MIIDHIKYKEHIKRQPCAISGAGGGEDQLNDPHHLIPVGIGGSNGNYRDYILVPLQHKYHQELHQIGIITFSNKYEVNLFKHAILMLASYIATQKVTKMLTKMVLEELKNGL